MPLLLFDVLPEALLSTLLSEWIDPEHDLRTLVEQVLGVDPFRALVAQRGVTVRATKVLSEACLEWLRTHAVPVELWKTTDTLQALDGTVWDTWCCNGQLHSDDDLPAVVTAEGDQLWYQHDLCHRDGDRPAVIRANGDQRWYQHGKLHRGGDLPAIVLVDGERQWWQNDQVHRVMWADGSETQYPFGIAV